MGAGRRTVAAVKRLCAKSSVYGGGCLATPTARRKVPQYGHCSAHSGLTRCPDVGTLRREMSAFHDLLTKIRALPPSAVRGVAESAGVPYSTLRKLRDGSTANPRVKTVEALKRALDADAEVSAE